MSASAAARCAGWLLIVLIVLIAVSPRLAHGQTPAPGPSRRPVAVFAADGAGDYRLASLMLRTVVDEDELPIEVHGFEWSHGYARILSDQMAFSHARQKANELAAMIVAYHAAYPTTPICVYAHSAGCAVAIKAVESLPTGIVDRLILLAPAVSANYDLAPALERVNHGMHVFYSRNDWCFLGLCTYVIGTADRRFSCCGGRVGFRVDPDRLDPALATKLVQYPWQPEDRALGNTGGHWGGYQPAYLRAHVVPLLLEP